MKTISKTFLLICLILAPYTVCAFDVIPVDSDARKGEIINIPIYLSGIDETIHLDSFGFNVEYSPSVLSFLRADNDDTLIDEFTLFEGREIGSGKAKVGGSHFGDPIPIASDCKILTLQFLVNENAIDDSKIKLLNFTDNFLNVSSSYSMFVLTKPLQLNHIQDQSMDEDTELTLSVSASFVENSDNLIFSATSGNELLNVRMQNNELTLRPHANWSGSTQVTVTVNEGSFSDSQMFTLNVQPVNDPPSISNIVDQYAKMNEALTIPFAMSDIDEDILNVQFSSSNDALISDNNVFLNDTNQNLILLPETDQFGSTMITVEVSDGSITTTKTFTVVIQSLMIKVEKTLESLTNDSLNIPIVLINPGNIPLEGLDIKLTLSHPDVLSFDEATLEGGILNDQGYIMQYGIFEDYILLTIYATRDLYDGNGVIGFVNCTATGNVNQTSELQIIAMINDKAVEVDHGLFRVNAKPTISETNDIVVNMNSGTTSIPFTINDEGIHSNHLDIQVQSSNSSVIPLSHMEIHGANDNRSLSITLPEDVSGESQISIIVSDRSSSSTESFNVLVNRPPIANSVRFETDEDASVTVTLSATDAENHTISYMLLSQPEHGELSGDLPHLTYTPETNYCNQDSFTFKVNDGYADSEPATVSLSVHPVNDPPEMSQIPAITLNQSIQSQAVSFTVTDIDTSVNDLVLSANIDDSNIISDIIFSGTGHNKSLIVIPVEDKFGQETITVSVSDGEYVESTSLHVTVNHVNLQIQTETTGYLGSVVFVPITLTSNLPVNDLNIIVNHDPGVLKAVSSTLVGGVLENNYEMEILTENDSTEIDIWLKQGFDAIIPDQVILYIQYDVLNDPNSLDIQTPLIISNAQMNGNAIDHENGIFTAIGHTINGYCGYYADLNHPISNTLISLSGAGLYTTLSNSSGQYSFYGIPAGTYDLQAEKKKKPHSLGATDAARISLFIVSKVDFTCLNRIAADVSQNGIISSVDASRLARFVSGQLDCMNDNCDFWTFLPENITNCNDWPPIEYTSNTLIDLSSDMSEITMISIPLGEVSDNYTVQNPLIPKNRNRKSTTIQSNNEQIIIPIAIEQVEILGLDIGIHYSDTIKLVDVSLDGGVLSSWDYNLVVNDSNKGKASIVIYSTSDVTDEQGKIVFLTFQKMSDEPATISLDKLICNDSSVQGGFYINENKLVGQVKLIPYSNN
ncbi:conserved hypothetical protein, secreted [Candidatus Magnetomorum sp. HK-1]|nr:conserved hypothetical protein, secreted [Candidatus Magnetomorum sp. HK-1]